MSMIHIRYLCHMIQQREKAVYDWSGVVVKDRSSYMVMVLYGSPCHYGHDFNSRD